MHRTTDAERASLAARGFSDGAEGNHERDVEVDDLTGAVRVAEETVEILERTMGWTPRLRTTLQVVHSGTALAAPPMRFEARGVDAFDAGGVPGEDATYHVDSFDALEDAVACAKAAAGRAHCGSSELRDRRVVVDSKTGEVVFSC